MKRVSVWSLGFGAVLALALILIATSIPPAQAAEQDAPKGPFAVSNLEEPRRPANRYEAFGLIGTSLKLSDEELFPAPLNPKSGVDYQFTDIPSDQLEYAAIQQMRRHGLCSGLPDGTFRGRRPLTRWEWATVLQSVLGPLKARAAEPDCPFVFDPERARPLRTKPYTDVPQGHWAFKTVDELRQAGVLADVPAFSGNRPVTRGEVVADMKRLAGLFRMREAKR